MKFVDDASKKNIRWYNRNFFWIVTILYIVFNIIMFAVPGIKTAYYDFYTNTHWWFDDFRLFICKIWSSYLHAGFNHILHNMLAWFVCAFYVERKIGSFNFFLLLISLTIFSSGLLDNRWIGNSGMWFALVGYVLIDYLFSMRKQNRNLTNLIVGGVVLALQWFRLGFYDKSEGGIGWSLIPHQLIYNHAHLMGFISGVVVALIVSITQLYTQIKTNKTESEEFLPPKNNKFCKIFSIVMIVLISICWAWVPIYIGIQTHRPGVYVIYEIDCINNDAYDITYSLNKLSDCSETLQEKILGNNNNIRGQDVIYSWATENGITLKKVELLRSDGTYSLIYDHDEGFWYWDSSTSFPTYPSAEGLFGFGPQTLNYLHKSFRIEINE